MKTIARDMALGDADIRPTLKARVLEDHASEADTVLIEELGLCRGQVRVDIAVVNGLLHGIEIKSDRDSLRRLAGQTDLYSKVLDKVTLVVGERHLAEAQEIIPYWWGIHLVEATAVGPQFTIVRRAHRNSRLEPRLLVELLWLDEAMALLELRDAVRGMKGKPRAAVWDRVCEHFCAQEIAAAVRDRLKARAMRTRRS